MLLKLWHLPLHEVAEEGNCKCSFAVTTAPNHALVDQLLANGGHRASLDTERGRDVACEQRRWAKLGHGAEVLLLQVGQAIEANPKEIRVKVSDYSRGSVENVLAQDGR